MAQQIDINQIKTSVLEAIFPVGSIYTNKTNSTNPSTLLGFGTWVAVEGRVVVGKAPSGTFATAGATGGAETHTLTTTEIPSHTHPIYHYVGNAQTGATNLDDIPGSGNRNVASEVFMTNTRSTGGGGAHNNLQPYVVAYMWERTA